MLVLGYKWKGQGVKVEKTEPSKKRMLLSRTQPNQSKQFNNKNDPKIERKHTLLA